MAGSLTRVTFIIFFYSFLAFPLFYFVYKFGDPEPLAHDFFQYYRLYLHWDVDNVNAPFNMRLAGPAIVHLFYEAGFSYDTSIVFDKYHSWGFLKPVFFCATFFNYLCVAATCVQIYSLLKQEGFEIILSFVGGMLYLLGFGTMFYEMMPITDAFSVFLFSVALRFYIQQNKLIFIPLVILIFQREYVFMALSLIALMDWLRFERKKYYMITFVMSVVMFLIYFVLRKTIFYTPALDHQATPTFLLESLAEFRFPGFTYFKQLLLTLNLLLLYLGVLCYKRVHGFTIDKFELLKVLLLLLQIHLISMAAGHGNNTGRYFYIVVPFVIYLTVKEIAPLISDSQSKSVN